MTAPRVLWVVPRMIWPAASGGEIRVQSLLRHLSSRYRISLMLPVPEGREREYEARALYLERRWAEKVHLVPKKGWPSMGPRERVWPATVQAFHDPALAAAIRRRRADLVHLEFSEMGQYAEAAGEVGSVLLTEHDAGFLSRGRSYLPKSREDAAQWRRRVRYEKEVFRHCDRVIALSEADAAAFARLTRRDKIRVVPTGVNLEDFPFAGLERREPFSAVFVGYYPHFPNEDAAVRLCGEIWPRILSLAPQATLRLVGSRPTPRVESLAAPSVQVVGAVPRVSPQLARSRIFLSPVKLGRGFKGKLLEAFAAGTPVVASPESCDAMPDLKHGEHLLIARGPEAFARAALRLWRDDALSARLAAAARRYAQERFGYDRQAERLHRVYQEVLASKSARMVPCSSS